MNHPSGGGFWPEPSCQHLGPIGGEMSKGQQFLPPEGIVYPWIEGVGGSEVYHINIPSMAVGAIIGTGGSNIKQIIRDSAAFVTVF